MSDSPARVAAEIVECFKCPRLVAWREQVAIEKRASFRDEQYWGRPVPGFGDPRATLLIVGLAPAAHGGNRTGRVFTGDRSGDWLYGALYRAGYANQPTSVRTDDGLELDGAYVAAAVRCAPPDNKPTPQERDTCLPYLRRELALLSDVQVVVVLGQFAYDVMARELGIRPRPKFGHGVEVPVLRVAGAAGVPARAPARLPPVPAALPPRVPAGLRTVLCSYHPSQQNTFTGKLTEEMFDAVFQRSRALTSPMR